MPNWSDTSYKFQGKEEVIKDLADKIRAGGYEVSKSTTMPKALKIVQSPIHIVSNEEWKKHAAFCRKHKDEHGYIQTLPIKKSMYDRFIKKYGVANWYDWAIKNWRTKWNINKASRESVDCFKNTLTISVCSPWCGAYKWFETVCKEFGLDGELVDIEPGNNFFIKITVDNGEVKIIESEYFSEESIEEFGLERFEADFCDSFSLRDFNEKEREDYPKQVFSLFKKHGYSFEQFAKFAVCDYQKEEK